MIRPRCRDWSPLVTQQLRLRNLIQITGHNIEAEANTSVYFTLHLTLMSAPFFTSEPLDSFRNVIWAEINCQSIHKSTSQFVVVRVWQTSRFRTGDGGPLLDAKNARRMSSAGSVLNVKDLKRNSVDVNDEQRSGNAFDNDNDNSKDKVLFVWGVYFSGLVPITKRSEVKFIDNALVFYIHGGFFTSADYILAESVSKQCNHFYRSNSKQQLQPNKGPLTKSAANNVIATRGTTYNIGIGKNCDNLNSSRNSLNEANDASERKLKSSSVSPKRYDIDYSTGRLSPSCDVIAKLPHKQHQQPKKHDENTDEEYVITDPNVLKVRFLDKEFFKWEIRRSYNVQKLLRLQEKQRIFRKKTQSANEVMEKICMKSASCLNLQLIANKGMLYRPRGNPSIGRTLNRLLAAQQEQPKPEDLIRAQELRRKIETAKFRCRFLTMERDRYKLVLRQLHDKCSKLNDENIEKESWLMDDYRELSRSRDMAVEQKSLHASRRKTFEKIKETLIQRQYQLLGQLRDIYVIKERDRSGFYEINGIILPNTDALRMFYSTNQPGVTNAPLSLSVAMCYVAHVVLLCSSVLNIPLRNKIIYQGSASKIRDDIKVLSEHDREFPLFCRNIPPSDSLLYAAFLLNQNISQIKFMLNLHVSRDDLRSTLPNLLAILSVGEQTNECYVIQESASASFLAIDTQDAPMSSISETSIDMIISLPATKTYSISVENIAMSNHSSRQNIGSCRTRGSFSDEHLAKNHDEKLFRKLTSNTGDPHKTFSSEPIL